MVDIARCMSNISVQIEWEREAKRAKEKNQSEKKRVVSKMMGS